MAFKTPQMISRWLEDNQYRMDQPQQYYGDEPNSYRKDWDSTELRWLVFTCWPYENAAGNQSIPLVYKCINDWGAEFLADRWYLPSTPRDMRMLETADVPLFGIESRHQLMDFDVVGTSISYPVLSMAFIKQLQMSDIPVKWKDRATDPGAFPMVICGGQSYGNPEFIATVIDCYFCGEVEDEDDNPGLGAVNNRILEFKRAGKWRTERVWCYEELAKEFNFLYFPRFIDVIYDYEDRTDVGLELPSKQVMGYRCNLPGMRLPIVKRHVRDLDAVEGLTNPPLLYADPGMGAGDLEVGRGCPAWCAFCALTYRQKPYRQRSVPFMREFAATMKRQVGSVHFSPFSPDFPMHTQRKALISDLLENVNDEVDASSMRVDDFIADPDYIMLQVQGGMDHVTLGVEGNSQRMRDLVGKGCSDEDIKEAVARGIRAGITKFKLYMITNLPGEDEGDMFRVLKLAKDLADIRDSMGKSSIRIQFSWTPLLIDPNTPFQWFPPPSSSRLLGEIWEEFRALKIDFKLGGKAEPNKFATFQLACRCSRDQGEAMTDVMIAIAQEPGKAFWGGLPKQIPGWEGMSTEQALNDSLRKHGFLNGLNDAWDERFKRDMFGWEFIDQGISWELLWVTYQQMREFVEQTDSHTYDQNFGDDYHGNEWIERCDTKCYGKTCGVCDPQDLKIRRNYITAIQHERHVKLEDVKVIDEKSNAARVRCRIIKAEGKRFIMNDHWRFHIRRAAYMASYELDTPWRIAKRSVKMISDAVKYKDFTCGVDYLEFSITRPAAKADVARWLHRMNTHMKDIRIDTVDWLLMPPTVPALRSTIDLSLWEMEVEDDPETMVRRLSEWEQAEYVKMVLKNDGGYSAMVNEEVNAKDYCDEVWVSREGHKLMLRMLLRGRPSPYNIYAALMGKASWIEASRYPAWRQEVFVEADENQIDFFRPVCLGSGKAIPCNPLDQPFHPEYGPKELDRALGKLVADHAGIV